MIQMRRGGLYLVATALALVASLSITSGNSAAQTPDASQSGGTPGAVACTIEPRSYDDLVTMFAEATPAAAVDVSERVTVPVGLPAGASTVEAVTATLQEAVACLNAGEMGRFLALVTPRVITTVFSWLGPEISQGNISEADFAVAVPLDPPQTIVAIGGVTVLADGRFTAVMILNDPQASSVAPVAMHMVLVQDGARLLIDEIAEFHMSSQDG